MVEGAWGALILVLAGITAVMTAACRLYRAALISLLIAAGTFGARALITSLYASEFVDYEGRSVRPYEVYNGGAGIIPFPLAALVVLLVVALCLSYLRKAIRQGLKGLRSSVRRPGARPPALQTAPPGTGAPPTDERTEIQPGSSEEIRGARSGGRR